MRFTISIFVVLLCRVAIAGYEAPNPAYGPGSYYPTMPPSGTGTTLQANLRAIITAGGFTQPNFDDVRFILDETDTDPANSNNVLLIYSRASVPGVWDGGATWIREHIWADSRLGPGNNDPSPSYKGPASDLFNLRPVNPGIKSSRGNQNFGSSGSSGSYGQNDNYWFPSDADKGDVARGLFYMATAYSHLSIVNGDPGADNSQIGDLQALLEWHYTDGIDNFERRRNDVIFDKQHNRNPYVDHPEYVWAAFGGSANNSQITTASSTISLGTVFVGNFLPKPNISISKTGFTPTTYDIILGGSATTTAAGTGQPFNYNNVNRTIAVGLTASSNATAGAKSGTITIDNTDLTSAGAGQGSADANDVVTVTATVMAHANASFNSVSDANTLALNFGTVFVGSAPTLQFAISNLNVAPGFTAALKASSIFATGNPGFITSDITLFTGLAAGNSKAFTASVNTSTPGIYEVDYTITLTDDVTFPGALAQQIALEITATVVDGLRLGDFNVDGLVTSADIQAMLKALNNLDAYKSMKSLTPQGLLAIGDLNHDNQVTNRDIQGLLNLLANGGSVAAVPEPATVVLLALGMAVIAVMRGLPKNSELPKNYLF